MLTMIWNAIKTRIKLFIIRRWIRYNFKNRSGDKYITR